MPDRKDYLDALQRERTFVEQTVHDKDARKARLDAIDAELDQYGEKPSKRRRETAAKDAGGKAAEADGAADGS